MKNLFSLCICVAISVVVSAQDAPDFTITDIDGNTRHLYTELNSGNTVVLKFFTNWCSICNATADEVQALWESYQMNGDDVVFWALNRDQNETNAHATTYRDNHSLTFPVIGEAYAVAQAYGVVYQPEYYIICPDRSYVMKTSYSQVDGPVQTCLASTGTGIAELDNAIVPEIHGNIFAWGASASSKGKLSVIDMSGRLVFSEKINGFDELELDLTTGIYLFTLEQGNKVIATGKFGIAQ